MPLSEEELRLLEQMERALVEEDPKFASTLRGTTMQRTARRRAVLAGVVFLLGVTGLMSGAIMRITLLGIAGFVVMLLSATVALTALRGHRRAASGGYDAEETEGEPGLRVIPGGRRPRRAPRAERHSSFMQRMEQRWRRRRDQGY